MKNENKLCVYKESTSLLNVFFTEVYNGVYIVNN